MNSLNLTATIISLNEEENIAKCLESLKGLTDEIILVDSGSKDKTVEIAKKYRAKVYERHFDNYANQKNFAQQKASGNWILSVDADEEISPDLSGEIKSVLKNPGHAAYMIPRKNIILGKFIKHTRWDPDLDRHIWLWKKGTGVWEGEVHEEVVVKGTVGDLRNPKIHTQYERVSDFFTMMNRYSEFEARGLQRKHASFSFFRLVLDPVYNFGVRFFYRLGFLDGWRGFVLSYLMAIYHLILWIKVWQKNTNAQS